MQKTSHNVNTFSKHKNKVKKTNDMFLIRFISVAHPMRFATYWKSLGSLYHICYRKVHSVHTFTMTNQLQ